MTKIFAMLRILKLAFLLLIAKFSHSQNINRTLSTANSDYECGMEKMASTYNQLYVYGFGGTNLQFGYKIFTPTNGTHKLFVSKYNDTGLYIKSVILGGLGGNSNGYACALGNSLTCYSGIYSGGYSENNTNYQPSNKKGMFVTALDSSLKSTWRLFLNANDKFHCSLLCPDGKGNLFAAGYFSDSFSAGSFKFTSTRVSGQTAKAKDIFLLLISSSGVVLKAQTFGGTGNDYPTALTSDFKGNAILSAIISDTVNLGDYYYPQQSNSRSIVFKTNMVGHTSWVTSFSGAGVALNGIGYDNSNRIICGANFKSALFVKSKSKTTKLNTSADYNQIGVVILDTFGNLLQYTTEGSVNDCTLTTLTLDPEGNIYVAGNFTCTFSGLNKINTSWSFKNIGFGDMYIAAYKSDLTSMYQRQLGGTQTDYANHLIYWKGKPVLCGNFKKDLQLTCDSNVKATVNVWSNFSLIREYYMGYSPGPYKNLMSLNYNGPKNYCGFVTDIIDDKSQLNNNFQRTSNPKVPFSEDAKWEFEINNTPNSTCESSNLRFSWIQQFTFNSSRGSYLEYVLNGKSYTYDNLVNYRFSKTTYHNLIINSLDKCYSDTLTATHVIVPREYVVINYDKTKYPQNIVLCKNDSICLTASNTKGLKYYWIVSDYKYVLDTGNLYNPEKTWKYAINHRDTFWKSTICIHKKAYVELLVEQNNICLEGRSIAIEQDKLGADDSFVYYFQDTFSYFCKGDNNPYENFKIRIIDKKTGYYRNPNLLVNIKINGKSYSTTSQTNFNVQIPDTGKITVSGTVQLGCDIYNFSLSRNIHLSKPKISISGDLSNCHTADKIFSVDSGFIMYEWNVWGAPDAPKITFITPWQIKVSGSSQNISVIVYADTNQGRECYIRDYKNAPNFTPVNITSSLTPPQLCPATNVTLSSGYAKEYSWFPSGETTQTITVSEPGTYYCSVKDTGDCKYVTNKIEVLGYFEPDILIAPDDGICVGKDADIFIIAPKNAAVKWTNPISWGANVHVSTNQPGIYYCDVKTCNVTYKLKAQILTKPLDNHTLSFTYNICNGQTLKLSSHDSETYAYQWTPTNLDSRYLYTKVAGNYVVQARDICDNWYNSDLFDVIQSNGTGNTGNLDTLICGWNSTSINLRNKYLTLDSNFSCLWTDNNDTSFQRTFTPGKTNVAALIKNKYCSIPDTFNVKITNHITPVVKIKPPSDVCKGETVKLEALLNDTNGNQSAIVWDHNLGMGFVKYMNVLIPNWIKASYKDTCGISSDSVHVVPIEVKAMFDITYDIKTDSITLTDKSFGTNLIQHLWYIDGQLKGQNKILQMASPFNSTTKSCLLIENIKGCKDSICKILPTYNDGKVYVPDAFYPNSKIDVNQRFEPHSAKYTEYKMYIYNRWGEKLFEGDNSTKGWDGNYMGTRCISGYYVYIIYVKFTNQNSTPRTDIYKGTVLLLE